MNVISLFFVSSSLFPVERKHISLLPLAILFMTQCFVLLSVLLPLSFSSRCFPLLLLSSLFSFSVFLRHSGNISINGAMLESPSSFSSQVLHFLFRLHYCFYFLMHVGKSPSTFMSLSLPPPSLVHLSLLWFLCDHLLTTHSPSFFSSSHSLLTTAHSRCDEFFDLPFLHLIFDFSFYVLVFDVFQVSTLYCLHNNLTID